MTTTIVSWKEAALQAANDYRAQRAEDNADRQAKEDVQHGTILKKKLDDLGIPTPESVIGRTLVVDGVKFYLYISRYDYRTEYDLTVLGTCPGCGEEHPSGDIHALSAIGGLLETFEARYHECSFSLTRIPYEAVPRPTETPETKLLAALGQWIDWRTGGSA